MSNRPVFHSAIMIHKSALRKHNKYSGLPLLLWPLVVFFCLSACDNANFIHPKLISTPLLMGSNEFGVINTSYAKGFAETNLDSMVLTIHRGGDIVTVVKRSSGQEKLDGALDYWYQVRSGDQLSWVFGNWLDQFPLEMQAKTASAIIREREFGAQANVAKPRQ